MELALYDRNQVEQKARAAGQQAEEALERAKAITIQTDADQERAAALHIEFKGRADAIDAVRKKLKAPILEAGREIDKFFNPPIKAFRQAAQLVGKAIGEYAERKRQEREEAEAKIRAQAERERQRRLAWAEYARKKAEEAARKAQEVEDEAERRKLLREQERAEARAEMHEAKAEAVEMPTLPEPESPPGMQMVTTWDYEVQDINKLIVAAAERPELRSLLTIDKGAMRRYISAVRDTIEIPGVRVFKRLTPRRERR